MAVQRKYNRKRSRYSKYEKLAYQLGQIERGKNNPNSKVHESFNKGLANPVKKPKKSMF